MDDSLFKVLLRGAAAFKKYPIGVGQGQAGMATRKVGVEFGNALKQVAGCRDALFVGRVDSPNGVTK